MPLEIRGLLGKRAHPQSGPRHGVSSVDVVTPQTMRAPETVYRTLLGTDHDLRREPRKYNIDEILLESASPVDFSGYDDDIPLFVQAQQSGKLETGKPYVASGVITVEEDSQAVLKTARGPIRLGEIGAHAQRMFLTDLAGQEMVLPIVVDQINDKEVQARPGETAAYLLPNPDLWTRRRLRKIDGRAEFESEVLKIDEGDTGALTFQTEQGRNWFWSKVRTVFFNNGRPTYDQGTESRPTGDVLVKPHDQVKLSAQFMDGRMFLTNVSLVDFSPEHAREYTEQRQVIEQGFEFLEMLLTKSELQQIRTPNGKEFDVSEPHKRGAVMRYIFAELRQRQQSFTPEQHAKLWELVALMPDDQKPVIFNNFNAGSKPDPRREKLDQYFLQQDSESKLPRLAESMTPAQLLEEMSLIGATHDAPLPLEMMMGIIHDYQGQFPEDASSFLVQSVLFYREKQLSAGENPHPAIVSLLDVLPYLQEQQDGRYQADWLVHLIQAGGLLAMGNSDAWKDSPDLQYFMRCCLKLLGSTIYTDTNYFGINDSALVALQPFYTNHLQYWPEHLPYGLGQEPVIIQLVRDLGLIDKGRTQQVPSHRSLEERVEVGEFSQLDEWQHASVTGGTL